jgi:long-chain acyl-CoA synthetase
MFNKLELSYIKGADINVPDTSIYEYLLMRSRRSGNRIVSKCHEDELSLARLQAESEIYAKAFKKLGVREGDIVPMCLPPCNEALIAFFALNRLGAVSTFLSAASSGEELEKYIKRFDSRFFLTTPKHAAELPEIIENCGLDQTVVITSQDALGTVKDPCALTRALLANPAGYPSHDRIMSLTALRNLGRNAVGSPDARPSMKRPAFISYTSGTTGEPKAIYMSNENIIAEIISELKTSLIPLGPRGTALQVVPFNYPYGFIISTLVPIYAGRTAGLTPLLTLSGVKDYLSMYRPYLIFAIPSFYNYMKGAPEFERFDLSFLKYAASGGDKLDVTDKLRINDFFAAHGSRAKILDGSGNGEGGGALASPSPLFNKYNPNSIGKINYGLSVKFIGSDGKPVPLGQTGKFCFAGRNVMMEYYHAPEETSKVLFKDEDGTTWFHTDMLGHVDERGWIYFDGRERRFFITYDISGSPYKVYCDHVQDIVKKSGLVLDCAVVQGPDPVRCMLPKAFIKVANGMDFDEAVNRIREFCSKELQSYAVPVTFTPITSLPLTKAGKVDYRALEKAAESA